jgi:hypothetical protein
MFGQLSFYGKNYELILTKKLGYILVDFIINSSGDNPTTPVP